MPTKQVIALFWSFLTAETFREFKREILAKAEHSRTNKPLSKRLIKEFEENEKKKDDELERVRLRNISLRTTLRKVERTLKAGNSAPILDCMRLDGEGLALTKHNYYSNKFDTTAWNDFDAIPRSASNFGLDDHGGSRKRLLFTRRQATCEGNEAKLEVAYSKMTMPNTRRMNLITNVAVENA